MTAATVVVFLLSYALIAVRRLHLLPIGRPAGALLGAVLMVAIGALTPAEAYRAIDHDTIVLLLGMMLIAAYLERAGFFSWAGAAVLRRGGTPRRLLLGLGLTAAGLSAFLVNDPVCLFMTPVVVAACRQGGLPFAPYLMALATCANVGSAATLVGNPQNMLVGSLSGLAFSRFLLCSLPAVLIGLALNLALLLLIYRRDLPAAFAAAPDAADPAAVRPAQLRRCLLVLGGVVLAFFAGGHLGFTALGGAVVLMVLEREEPTAVFARVDWSLLVFFSALFVVVAALERTGLVAQAWGALRPWLSLQHPAGVAGFTAAMTLGSNTVSNVPLVLLVGPLLGQLGGGPELGWVLLGFVTTVAGNLTLVGSVANIIVAEGAREHYTLGFFEYLRFGAVSTIAVLALGVPLLVAWSRLLGA